MNPTPERLVILCELGRVDYLERYKKEGVSFTNTDEMIEAACVRGQLEVVQFLREFLDIENSTSLSLAARHGHLDLVDYLLNEGVNSWNALFVAVLNDRKEIANFLVSRGVDVNGFFFDNPLSCAVSKGNLEMSQLLLSNGANPNPRDQNGETPLFHALRLKDHNLMKLLISCGADVNALDDEGQCLFHHVSDLEDVWFLLGNNCNLKVISKNGTSPLLPAVAKSNFQLATFFLAQGLSSREKNQCCESPLSMALKVQSLEIFELFVNSEINKRKISYIWHKFKLYNLENREAFIQVLLVNAVPFQ